MKAIVESLKANREQLINKYNEKNQELESIREEMEKTLGRSASKYDSLKWRLAEVTYEKKEILRAINDLENAIQHLGENVDTFLGE